MASGTGTGTPSTASTVITDVLNDALLLGALAASIFVKNPNSQNEAANLINAVGKLIGVIEAQL